MFFTITQTRYRNSSLIRPASLPESSYTPAPLFRGSTAPDQFEYKVQLLKSPPPHITPLTPAELKLISQYQQVGRQLDKGGYGTTYLIPQPSGRLIVIKVPHDNKKTDFAHEADILFNLPQSKPDEQHLELLGLLRLNGKDILAMNFVNGKKFTSSLETPLNEGQLKSLLNKLLTLDLAHIYHADLKPSNLLLEPEQTNLVDYGDAFKTNPSRHEPLFNPVLNIFVPEFAFFDNATHFQTRAFPSHAHKILETNPQEGPAIITRLFQNFLQQKAQGQSTYANSIRENKGEFAQTDIAPPNEALDYTKLQAKFLTHPSNDLLIQQAWKTEALFCSTMSGRQVAFSNNLKMAYEWANLAKESVCQYQQLTDTLSHQSGQGTMQDAQEIKDYQRFLDYERRYGAFIQQGIEEKLIKEPKASEVKKSSAPPIKPQLLLAPTISSLLQNHPIALRHVSGTI